MISVSLHEDFASINAYYIIFKYRLALWQLFAGSDPLMSFPSNPEDDIQQRIDYYNNVPIDHFVNCRDRYFSSYEI